MRARRNDPAERAMMSFSGKFKEKRLEVLGVLGVLGELKRVVLGHGAGGGLQRAGVGG